MDTDVASPRRRARSSERHAFALGTIRRPESAPHRLADLPAPIPKAQSEMEQSTCPFPLGSSRARAPGRATRLSSTPWVHGHPVLARSASAASGDAETNSRCVVGNRRRGIRHSVSETNVGWFETSILTSYRHTVRLLLGTEASRRSGMAISTANSNDGRTESRRGRRPDHTRSRPSVARSGMSRRSSPSRAVSRSVMSASPRKASTSRKLDLPLAFGPTRTWNPARGCDTYRSERK